MNESHMPTDVVIIDAWEDMRESLTDAAKLEAARMCFEARGLTPIEQVVFYRLESRMPWSGFDHHPQFKIGNYTVDFYVHIDNGVRDEKIIVECDGHDFHERTKEQAQHDKKRDRDLQDRGYKVYRFTGSEIWKTRGRCVTEALGLD